MPSRNYRSKRVSRKSGNRVSKRNTRKLSRKISRKVRKTLRKVSKKVRKTLRKVSKKLSRKNSRRSSRRGSRRSLRRSSRRNTRRRLRGGAAPASQPQQVDPTKPFQYYYVNADSPSFDKGGNQISSDSGIVKVETIFCGKLDDSGKWIQYSKDAGPRGPSIDSFIKVENAIAVEKWLSNPGAKYTLIGKENPIHFGGTPIFVTKESSDDSSATNMNIVPEVTGQTSTIVRSEFVHDPPPLDGDKPENFVIISYELPKYEGKFYVKNNTGEIVKGITGKEAIRVKIGDTIINNGDNEDDVTGPIMGFRFNDKSITYEDSAKGHAEFKEGHLYLTKIDVGTLKSSGGEVLIKFNPKVTVAIGQGKNLTDVVLDPFIDSKYNFDNTLIDLSTGSPPTPASGTTTTEGKLLIDSEEMDKDFCKHCATEMKGKSITESKTLDKFKINGNFYIITDDTVPNLINPNIKSIIIKGEQTGTLTTDQNGLIKTRTELTKKQLGVFNVDFTE